jgi:hypothetical protein
LVTVTAVEAGAPDTLFTEGCSDVLPSAEGGEDDARSEMSVDDEAQEGTVDSDGFSDDEESLRWS